MKNRDIEILLHFITRTEMYTFKDKAKYIIAFIHGYDFGRNGKCDFLNQLTEMLAKEFNCPKNARGWNGQIIDFGKKNNLTWETSFKKIGLKVLSKHFQNKSKKKYENILKTIIQSMIKQIKIVKFENQDWTLNRFGKRWIEKWIGLVDLEKKWFQDIWTTKQLKIIFSINKEISKIEDKEQLEIIASKKLIKLANKFKKRTPKQIENNNQAI